MKWPFVFRSLFEYQERELGAAREEIRELRKEQRRVVDEINFRSTGFHLYPEFEKSRDETPAIPQAQPAQIEMSPIDAAVNRVGTRMTAVRAELEAQHSRSLQSDEKKWADGAEQRRQAELIARMESALSKPLGINTETAAPQA